jgi:Bacterial regulatory protein, arsR family
MFRVEVLSENLGRDPETVFTERPASEMLDNEPYASHLVERTGWALVDVEQQEQTTQARAGSSAEAAPARSVRRASARRASNRRATARSRQGDIEASIIDFLAQHEGSTAGDLAKGLNLDPGSVSIHLIQLAKAGEIKKASHGYSASEAARPRKHRRATHRSH